MGNPYIKNCYVCRKYFNESGQTDYNTTQWRLFTYNMPLHVLDRSVLGNNDERKFPCLHEASFGNPR